MNSIPRLFTPPDVSGIQLSMEQNFSLRNHVWSMQAFIQILPLWISFLNQLNLPGSLPLLDSFLSRNCRLHGGMEFISNQQVKLVALREAVRKIVLVLPDAFHEVGSHA